MLIVPRNSIQSSTAGNFYIQHFIELQNRQNKMHLYYYRTSALRNIELLKRQVAITR